MPQRTLLGLRASASLIVTGQLAGVTRPPLLIETVGAFMQRLGYWASSLAPFEAGPENPDRVKSSFEPREGGLIRISLTYDEPGASGKSSAQTDTYHGRFVRLIPDQLVVEVMEFETADPAMRGEMTVTFSLSDTDGGTELRAEHDNLPAGISAADNELGWSMSLAKLKQLVETT